MIRQRTRSWLLGVAAAALIAGCQPAGEQASTEPAAPADARPAANPLKNAYFGDLHVHTRYSFDAYIFNVRATPDDAYRFAKGEAIKHTLGQDLKLGGPPLDFFAVTDHAEYLGVLPAIDTEGHPFSQVPYADQIFSSDLSIVNAAFRRFGDSLRAGQRMPEFADMATTRSAWADIVATAEKHNEPGKFTTFAAYEYTSARDGQNLHRNVIFEGSNVPAEPFSALESRNPADLWTWLDARRAEGVEGLAIPHNSNGSDGRMFERQKWTGEPIDQAWAEQRIRNEPLVEVTQVKGTSETHPSLSPNDEWAGFEVMEWYIGSATPVTKFAGGYAREALRAGIEMQARDGYNPYKFGLVGASDTHNAGASYREDDYNSKVGVMDGAPDRRGSVIPAGAGDTWEQYTIPDGVKRYATWGASGLTGVWAEENTRPSIYSAFRRKETFATTGPRIKVRFFAGAGIGDADLSSEDGLKRAYDAGVPMGGDMVVAAGASPDFLVWAMRDANAAPLQRVQIVKGWTTASGGTAEKVFDVACSDGGAVDPATHRCPDNGATVDLATCGVSADKGDAELKAAWKDPEFDPAQHAFYYVRVLENPTCRWSTWDAVKAGKTPNPALEKTVQERAYTSPIWYVPTRAG